MTSPHIRSNGLAKTRARALEGQGYMFHVTRAISAARPSVIEMDLVMSPIADEKLTVYSFVSKTDMDAFVAQYGGEAL